MRHNLPGETMNAAAVFFTENTSNTLPSGGLDSLFFPLRISKKAPQLRGFFLAYRPNMSC